MKNVFPISVVMNKAFSMHHAEGHLFFEENKRFSDGDDQLVGIAPHFVRQERKYFKEEDLPSFRELEHEEYYEMRKLEERNPYTPATELEKKKELLRQEFEEKYDGVRQIFNIENVEGGAFHSSVGDIFIPLPFDKLVAIVSLAQQGMIVRLGYEGTKTVPTLSLMQPKNAFAEAMKAAGQKPKPVQRGLVL